MRNKVPVYIALALGLVLIIHACTTTKAAVNGVRNMNERELREILFAKDTVPFDFFYGKVGVDFKSEARSMTFNATVKMRIDSAFSGTIKYFGVIGGFYLLTADSMHFVNKQQKCYIQEDLTYISSLFGTKIEYDFFQSLILGLPIGLDPDIKYQQIKSKEDYILSSHKKKDFKKLEQDRLDLSENDDIFIQYHMAPESFDLTSINIQVPADTVEIDIDFKERKLQDEQYWVPGKTHISLILPRDSISITLDYGTVQINDPKKINITIPDSYEPCP